MGRGEKGSVWEVGKGMGKGVLDAGVHLDVSAHWFCGIDVLCFLSFLSFFFFGGF